MPSELRQGFHRALERNLLSLGAVLGVLPEAIGQATDAMLAGDRGIAAHVAGWRSMVSDIGAEIDAAAGTLIALQSPVAGDLRQLLAVTRLVPVLADTVDLVADIASPVLVEVGDELPERTRLLVAELGATSASTWLAVDELWRDRRSVHLDSVRNRDDSLSEVRSSLNSDLASGSVDVTVAMLVAMAGRSYERMGRHASAAARLIEPLVASDGLHDFAPAAP